MVDAEDVFTTRNFSIDLQDQGHEDTSEMKLTEGGGLSVEVNNDRLTTAHPHETWSKIESTDQYGREVVLKKVLSASRSQGKQKIDPVKATIKQNPDYTVSDGEEVVIDFDIMCLSPTVPRWSPPDRSTTTTIEKIQDNNPELPKVNIPNESEILYIDNEYFSIYGVPLTDTSDRIKSIRNGGPPIRTGKIRAKQRIPGTINHQVNYITPEIRKVMEISQVVQEVTPSCIRTKVISIGDVPAKARNVHYEVLRAGTTGNTGGRFRQYPQKVIGGNFPEYIAVAYDNYTDQVRNQLRLRQVLGYYIDSRLEQRPVEGKLLSTCSAIELLALRYAQENDKSTKTGSKIAHLINDLGVQTDDLAEYTTTNVNSLDYPEYFWYRERNHVVHGVFDFSVSQLSMTQEATLVLLKRLIRNILLEDERNRFENFYNISPRKHIQFG